MKIRTVRRLRFWSPIALTLAILMIGVWVVARPALARFLYAKDYAELAQQCDNAMHDEAAIRSYPREMEEREQLLLSAEVQLMVCHRYDKLRKRMLLMGVSENQLALYGLQQMEIEAVPVQKLVRPHEMPRF